MHGNAVKPLMNSCMHIHRKTKLIWCFVIDNFSPDEANAGNFDSSIFRQCWGVHVLTCCDIIIKWVLTDWLNYSIVNCNFAKMLTEV